MWIEAIIIGIFLGLIKEGRIENIGKFEFRSSYLLLVGVVLQMLPFFLHNNIYLYNNSNYIIMLGLLLNIAFFVFNLSYSNFVFVLLGSSFNILGFLLNGFKMPILVTTNAHLSLLKIKDAIIMKDIRNYVLFENANPIFKFLGKIIVLPSWYPFTHVLSIGDIIIGIGIILLLRRQMLIHKQNYFKKSPPSGRPLSRRRR